MCNGVRMCVYMFCTKYAITTSWNQMDTSQILETVYVGLVVKFSSSPFVCNKRDCIT